MGREAARPQDRLESALLQGEPGRRPRGLVRAVRSAPGDRVPVRVHARRRGTRGGATGERQPMITLPTLLLVLAADSGVAVIPRPAHVAPGSGAFVVRSEEHTSELQSQSNLVCRLLLEKKKKSTNRAYAPHCANIVNHQSLQAQTVSDVLAPT